MSEIIQGSPEWFAARCGKVTASRIADLSAQTKTGWGAGRANYMAQLIADRLTGNVAESFSNAAMQWGTDTEPLARSAYAFFKDATIQEVGFVDHPTIPMSGASPDGLVGENGLVEIKCPNTSTHIETLLNSKIPAKYIKQMQWQMACTGREWCDFVSFDPRMPEHLCIFVDRVHAEGISELETQVKDFIAEMEEKITELSNLTRKAA